MSSGMKHLRITGRDLRIAKINKKVRVQPCAKEFSAFISAVEMYGDGKVPLAITKQLTDCMEVKVNEWL